MSLARMISRAKIPTSRSKLASYSYHLVQCLPVSINFSLLIFFPTSDSDCSHVIWQLPVHKFYTNNQKRSSHSGERERQPSPECLSRLAFFSVIDCPTCLQYNRIQLTVKSHNGSDHQSAQLSAFRHVSLVLIASNQITRSLQTLNHLGFLKCHC